jgi:hypothetical protein
MRYGTIILHDYGQGCGNRHLTQLKVLFYFSLAVNEENHEIHQGR